MARLVSKCSMGLAVVLIALMWVAPVRADTGVIVRTTNLPALQTLCVLPTTCTVLLPALDGTLGQVFLVTTPLPVSTLLNLLQPLLGFVSAEVDQLISLVGPLLVPSPIPVTLMQDRTLVRYPANSTTMVWNSYANQPASTIVEVQNAQSMFSVTGTGIVADIDTGVDPTHPALQGVLLAGYDYTRNQPNGSELTDIPSGASCPFSSCPPPPCSSATCPGAAQVNQSSAAILDQSSAAILDGNPQYAAFGHGTMVLGVIHLVAPTAKLLPLKAFKSDGTGMLSDILRAMYDAVQKYNANVINMSFDFKTASSELTNAINYASGLGVICAASAGNDGMQETVYPAALQSAVMGVASVGSTSTTAGTRSTFSNFGNALVWVAAPGEAIVSTYPYGTYAAGWGTSFSAPFVSGGGALLRGLKSTMNQAEAAAAVAHAVPLQDPGLGNGRLDLVPALQSVSGGSGSPDFSVSTAPNAQTIPAGAIATYTVSATPANGFNQTVSWSCTGAPVAATCTVSPSSVTLDGSSTASATVTFTTTARATTMPQLRRQPPPLMPIWGVLIACLAWLLVAGMLWSSGRTHSQRPSLAVTAGLLAVSLITYSCGGYGGGGGLGSPTLSSVSLSANSVNGGSSTTGTATLSGAAPTGGALVYLSSSTSVATVPASVTVAAGATTATFTVNTTAVTASTPVTISASYAGATKTAALTITPAGSVATLASVALNPSSVTGGSPSAGTVTLSGAAPSGGAIVSLSSSSPSATVPASATVAAGASSAAFTVNTSAVTASTPVTISASYAGVTKTASFSVEPQGTPAGTYMLTITGTSGSLVHAATVQVTVN